MLTIYDLYPYSEDALTEFKLMQQLPDQADMASFADTVSKSVESDNNPYLTPSSGLGGEWRSADLWLPEGIITARKLIMYLGNLSITTLVEMKINCNQTLDDATITHDYRITLNYSPEQIRDFAQRYDRRDLSPRTSLPYSHYPFLTDAGVIDRTGSANLEMLDLILDLRADTAPRTLKISLGTLNEDLAAAEEQSKTRELANELAQSGELINFIDIDRVSSPSKTACSQRTIRMATALLGQYMI